MEDIQFGSQSNSCHPMELKPSSISTLVKLDNTDIGLWNSVRPNATLCLPPRLSCT